MKQLFAKLALTVSVLLHMDPVEVIVYVDRVPVAGTMDKIVADAACRYIRAEEIPLPVPYTVRMFQRSGESHRYVPQQSPIGIGLLSKCPPLLDSRGESGTAAE
jgi:hypothetical protein